MSVPIAQKGIIMAKHIPWTRSHKPAHPESSNTTVTDGGNVVQASGPKKPNKKTGRKSANNDWNEGEQEGG